MSRKLYSITTVPLHFQLYFYDLSVHAKTQTSPSITILNFYLKIKLLLNHMYESSFF